MVRTDPVSTGVSDNQTKSMIRYRRSRSTFGGLLVPSAPLAASLSFALVASGIALGASQEDRRTPRAKAVLVSQLDPTLPTISLDQWMSALARSGTSVQWTPTNCPATYRHDDPRYPICVIARAQSVPRIHPNSGTIWEQ